MIDAYDDVIDGFVVFAVIHHDFVFSYSPSNCTPCRLRLHVFGMRFLPEMIETLLDICA